MPTNPPLARALHATTAAAGLAAAALLATPAQAQLQGGQGFEPGAAVMAVVKVPTPWYAPRFFVTSKMRQTMPQYEALPGLAFKAFSFAQADGHFGGIYLWSDLASARAWFSPAWFERVARERGAPGEVRLFEVLAVIDTQPGGPPADAHSAAVAAIATAAVPAGAAKAELAGRLQRALAAQPPLPGLLRRMLVATEGGRYGHVSLWADQAAATQWLQRGKPAADVALGADSTVEWFDTPILLPGKAASGPALAAGTPRTMP
jgi:hypothetical protein